MPDLNDRAKALHREGLKLQSAGRLSEAEDFFRQSIDLQPREPRFLNNYGSLLGELGRHSEAEAAFRDALAVDPTYARARANLAVAQAKLGPPTKTQSVLITGANRGIGLALARILVAKGTSVIAAARRPGSVTVGKPVAIDVTSEQSLASAATTLRGVAIDVLVNNAAILPRDRGPLREDLQTFRDTFETNVLGALRVIRAFLPNLKKSRSPTIVNISSREGSISQKRGYDLCSYAVSKAALNSLTRMLASQLFDICVVAIAPGWVKTRMGGNQAPLTPEQSASALAKLIGRLTLADSGKFLDYDGQPIPF
jgi:NAD(P)-dependent dehydrogenase (short-subunit alcohol dehydrogenase family)